MDPVEVGPAVAEVAVAADTVLGMYGVPGVVGDLSSAVMAAMAAMYGWRKLKNSEKGKMIG
jgi:hypothetical protein